MLSNLAATYNESKSCQDQLYLDLQAIENLPDELNIDDLCQAILRYSILLSGIDASWLKKFQTFSEANGNVGRIFNLIVTVKEASPVMMSVQMNRLTKLVLDLNTSNRGVLTGTSRSFKDVWPNLESTSIDIHLPQFQPRPNSARGAGVEIFFAFVFLKNRENVKKVELRSGNFNSFQLQLPINFLDSFQNISSLLLDVPAFQESHYFELFDCLQSLQYLVALNLTIRCFVTERIFIGDDYENPSFLNLRGC